MQEVVSGAVLGNGGTLNPKGISSSWDNLEEILRKAVRKRGFLERRLARRTVRRFGRKKKEPTKVGRARNEGRSWSISIESIQISPGIK